MAAYTIIDKALRATVATLQTTIGKLKGLAYKDKVEIGDIDASGDPSASTILFGNGTWGAVPAGGAVNVDTSAMTATWSDAKGNTVMADIIAQ